MKLAQHLGRAMLRVQANASRPLSAEAALQDAMQMIIANDDGDNQFADDNPDRLKVLTDPDAAKLVQKLFGQYVSESDFSTMVMFIKDFDKFLSKYRDRPLTRQEIEKIEQEQENGMGDADEGEIAQKPKKGRKRKAKSEDELEALPQTEDGADDQSADPDPEPDVAGDLPDDAEDDLPDEPSITISNYLSRQMRRRR